MSEKSRGYDESLFEGFNAQFAIHNRLIESSLGSESGTLLLGFFL